MRGRAAWAIGWLLPGATPHAADSVAARVVGKRLRDGESAR